MNAPGFLPDVIDLPPEVVDGYEARAERRAELWDDALDAVAAAPTASCLGCFAEYPAVGGALCPHCFLPEKAYDVVELEPHEVRRVRNDRYRLLRTMGVRIDRAAVRVPTTRRVYRGA